MNRPPSWLTAAFLGAVAVAAVIAVLIATDVVHPFGNDDNAGKAHRPATFTQACVKLTTVGGVTEAQATSYCDCLKSTAAHGRTKAQLDTLLADTNRALAEGTPVPGPMAKAAEPCARTSGVRG